MKRVLIVGAGSYIGESFAAYTKDRLSVDTVGTAGGEWERHDFSGYDSILHVAGIAHRSQKEAGGDIYFKVNRDLAVEVAQKAKAAGVGQFVFLSSMAVYGVKEGRIEKSTEPKTISNDYYGESKYQAERLLHEISDRHFKCCIIRPPMVYGQCCNGKFQSLVKVAKLLPVFPNINNKRSMIYIDNLCECIARIIERSAEGTFCPQNKEYVNTCDMLVTVTAAMGRKKSKLRILNPYVRLGMKAVSSLQTAFGSLYYAEGLDCTDVLGEYRVVGLEASIRRSVERRV